MFKHIILRLGSNLRENSVLCIA